MKMKELSIHVYQASNICMNKEKFKCEAQKKFVSMFHRSQRSRVTNKDRYYFLKEIGMVYCIHETTREAIRLEEISLHQI